MYIADLGPRNSLDTNPPAGVVLHVSLHGINWLWAATAVFAYAFIGFMVWGACVGYQSRRRFRRRVRGTAATTDTATTDAGTHDPAATHTDTDTHDAATPHHLATSTIALGAVAYFLMASDLGYTATPTEFGHYAPPNTTRQIWYVRWVYYVLANPLISLLVTQRAPASDQFMTAFMGAAWPAALLIGGLIRTSYKWGMFVFAVLFALYWLFMLACARPRAAANFENTTDTTGMTVLKASAAHIPAVCALTLATILTIVAWGCAEGGNVVSTTSEMVWYGVLDVVFKVGLLLYVLAAGTEPARVKVAPRAVEAGMAEEGVGEETEPVARTTSRGFGKKLFSRRGHHDAPVTEKAAGVAATGTEGTMDTAPATDMGGTGADMHTHTEPIGTNTDTAMDTHTAGDVGMMGTGTGTDMMGHDTHTGMMGHDNVPHESHPRLSEQTAVSDRYV